MIRRGRVWRRRWFRQLTSLNDVIGKPETARQRGDVIIVVVVVVGAASGAHAAVTER